MLVVNVDLWRWGNLPRGNEDRLVAVLIVNDGTGTHEVGNYKVWALNEWERADPHRAHRFRDSDARLKDVPREHDQGHVMHLVVQALDALIACGHAPKRVA